VAGAVKSPKGSWAVFGILLGLAVLFMLGTASELPPTVASHFDAAGYPSTFMPRAAYLRLVLGFGLGMPVAIVGILTAAYSRARNLRLPNRDYWLAPEHIGETRSFLVAHGIWFGSLLVLLVSFMHWLELKANHLAPPHLSNEAFAVGMLMFLIGTAVWIGAMMVKFRRTGR
jgi:hypothetical protein